MKKGFTLIELLIVIAIIGILSGIVATSLGGQQAKARDARCVTDLQTIALALEVYNGKNSTYPTLLTTLVTDNELPRVPVDPGTSVAYPYGAYASATWFSSGTLPIDAKTNCASGTNVCAGWALGANLEQSGSTYLSQGSVLPSANTGKGSDGTTATSVQGLTSKDCQGGTTAFCYFIHN